MIIGLSGQARVGKDTFADYLVKRYGFVKVGLADPMKRFCKDVFDFSDEQLYGDRRDDPDTRYPKGYVSLKPDGSVEPKYLTPRYALQRLGTEWGRDCYDDVWINYGIRVAKELLHGYATYSVKEGLQLTEKDTGICPGVVFSDLRFRNEFNAVRAAGGKMVRIYRPAITHTVGIEGHASEAEQKTIQDQEFDSVVVNHEGLDLYRRTIDELMSRMTSKR